MKTTARTLSTCIALAGALALLRLFPRGFILWAVARFQLRKR